MANLQQQSDAKDSAPSFESTPWIAAERAIEEPRRAPEPPLLLAGEENVIDLQESESIRLDR